ncbi:hypothetical protein HNV12_03895 [Methanococcoides sp. SA1]|nr:hypothetical protein [Methanococcoides sp. SA1]
MKKELDISVMKENMMYFYYTAQGAAQTPYWRIVSSAVINYLEACKKIAPHSNELGMNMKTFIDHTNDTISNFDKQVGEKIIGEIMAGDMEGLEFRF